MRKVVINKCFGGFSLSKRAKEMYALKKGFTEADGPIYEWEIDRDDQDLIYVVETLGGEANGTFAELKVVEIPDDIEYEVEEYDGNEHIAETHRTWG